MDVDTAQHTVQRLADAVRALAANDAAVEIGSLSEACVSLEAAMDGALIAWCIVQGGAWLSSVMKLHWQVKLEGALLRRSASSTALPSDLYDAFVESVSQASIDFLVQVLRMRQPSARRVVDVLTTGTVVS